MPDSRGFHIAVLLQDGSILISGGGDSTGAAVATNLLYTPVPRSAIRIERSEIGRPPGAVAERRLGLFR